MGYLGFLTPITLNLGLLATLRSEETEALQTKNLKDLLNWSLVSNMQY